jgi:glycosyltransferase involved in cell wall biosynthesis
VIDRGYAAWLVREPSPAEWRARLAAVQRPPRISVVMPVFNTNPVWLRDAVASVRAQIFANWELVIVDDASTDPAVAVCLAELAGDARIDVTRLATRGGIAAASNAALARADGDYVAFMDHDDLLAPHALAAMACELAAHPAAELVFSDEDQIVGGRRVRPYFKPGWNPDLLLSQNLVCHLAVYRRTLVTRLGGLRGDLAGAQDFDLALRVTAEVGPHRVRHVPLVLYHWRQSAGSFSCVERERCEHAARRAVGRHLAGQATVATDPVLPQWPAVRFHVPAPAPAVSLITEGVGAMSAAAYDPALVDVVARAAQAAGDVLVFLAGRLRALDDGWLRALVAEVSRPDIGAAGGLLLGPDGGWVHTGFVLHARRVAQSVAPASDAGDPGYRGHFALARTVSAVSIDCLAVRRDVFVAAGGLIADAGDFADVDLCLRLAARGLRTVWTPQARLRFAQSPPARGRGAAWMRQRWRDALAADPYCNPNLRLRGGRLSLA